MRRSRGGHISHLFEGKGLQISIGGVWGRGAKVRDRNEGKIGELQPRMRRGSISNQIPLFTPTNIKLSVFIKDEANEI